VTAPRRTRPDRTQDGSVLIVVLLLISVLVVSAVECLRLARLEKASSRIFQASFQGACLTDSGLAFAKYLLFLDATKEDGDESDHYGEPWAGFFQQDEHPRPEFESGQVNGSIVDEGGKFPVTSLVGEDGAINSDYASILERLLRYPPYSLEETEAQTIVQSLKDWQDTDDKPTGEFGAESAYYRAQEGPSACPNRQMRALTEMTSIRGVTQALYHGDQDRPGLKDLLSVHNQGGININTAPQLLLAAMAAPTVAPRTAADFAENAVSYRQDSDHFEFLKENDWYRNRLAGYNDIQLPASVVTTSSSVFAITVKAGPGKQGRSGLYAVLERQADQNGVELKTLWRERR
jgi:type II secretory pathway component PulK